MSVNGENYSIHCDGEGCIETTLQPVALRQTIDLSQRDSSRASGWLFVADRHGQKHLCPNCAEKYLREHMAK
jgi:hypothetical protein